jgi:hypothetical protein
LAEFIVSKFGASHLSLTYADTISDLVLSMTGGAVAATLVAATTSVRSQYQLVQTRSEG